MIKNQMQTVQPAWIVKPGSHVLSSSYGSRGLFLLLHYSAKGEDEFSADSLGADDIDMFIVGLDDFFYDGEAKAGPFLVFAAGEV